jgi:hypothetical protein
MGKTAGGSGKGPPRLKFFSKNKVERGFERVLADPGDFRKTLGESAFQSEGRVAGPGVFDISALLN